MQIFNSDGSHTEQASDLIDQCRKALKTIFSKRKWITAMPILVGSESTAQELLELGAEKVLAIGCAEGIRHAPLDEEIKAKLTSHCLGVSFGGDMMDGIRGGESVLDQLDQDSLAIIDTFDPDQEALVMRTIFSEGKAIGGRSVFGKRPKSWQALEDKMIIDQFWDLAGVKRAPSQNINLNWTELRQAFHNQNSGQGVVIAGDAKSGFHGGATRTRWAKTEEHLAIILDDLQSECAQARVMPLLNGVSCSMHGWVFPNGEYISLRPCEMLVTYSDQETKFEYHGAGSYWRPSAYIQEEMRESVEKAAELLSKDYGYRGVFTVDGIATKDGFLPSELNPRFGGALGRMSVALPELPLLSMHYASIEGYDLGVTPNELKELIISAAEAKPIIRAMVKLEEQCSNPQTVYFKKELEQWIVCSKPDEGKHTADQIHDAHIKWGTAISGSLIFAYIEPSCLDADQPSIAWVKKLLVSAKAYIQSHYL